MVRHLSPSSLLTCYNNYGSVYTPLLPDLLSQCHQWRPPICSHSLLSGRRQYASKKTIERKAQNTRQRKQPATKPNVTSSVLQRSTSPSGPTPRPRPREVSSPAPPAYIPQAAAYYQTLASRTAETPLYVAPPSRSLPLTAVLVSAFCTAYGTYHIYVNFALPQPDGLWWGIPWAFGGVSGLMLALGGWVAGTSRRHIGRIDAVPGQLISGGKPGELMLRLTRRQVLPFPSWLRKGAIDVRPADCTLGSRLATAHGSVEDARQSNHGGNVPEATGVFGGISGRVGEGISSFGRIVTRDGLVPFDVRATAGAKSKRWKLDVARRSWIGDGGLERLVRIRS